MGEKKIVTTCASHCGGTCVLNAYVKDGVILRIDTDSGDEPQLRACLKGRAYRHRVYAPDRLKFPMKRIGARGEGKFERIGWNEALDTVARQLKRVRDQYGPATILLLVGGGDLSQVHNARQFHKLLCRTGGYTRLWGGPSFQGGIFASIATYGTWRTGNSRDDLVNSRLIILWGWNPAVTVCGTNTCWYLAKAKEAGARIISVDPMHTDTAATLADQWIPIRPGTDAAMLLAMSYVIIAENLQDQQFLDTYTIGFDALKDYVLGSEDNVPKTPTWAETITGVPASLIEELAREYARIKPAALMAGIAPGRSAYGEQYHRAASTLAAMTGNIGIPGGSAGGRCWESGSWYPYKMTYGVSYRPEDGINPVEESSSGATAQPGMPTYASTSGIHRVLAGDFIIKGKAGGYPADLKLAFITNSNFLNQYPNINKFKKALQKLEFIVVLEQVMTATARYADILLPMTTFMERNDIVFGVGTPFYGFANKVIEPLGECRSHLDIAQELASRLGVKDFQNEDEEELLKEYVAESEIPDYDEFRQKGIYRINPGKSYIAFKKQIENPTQYKFDTPSGKIEIYSQTWADAGHPKIPPVASYLETWESKNDPLAEKYPLQLITSHMKRRTLGQYENIPWLKALEKQAIKISRADARIRGIHDGEQVRVFNDRGDMLITARVTERIMPGVVDIPQGAWYDPDAKGTDKGGNPNILTRDQCSPGGAFPYNTCLVQVEKVQGD